MSGGPASVLVVEDEENILELVTFNLKREGYKVTGVASGEEALAAARSKRPDLVVLDLMLPGIDGLEVCRRLRRDERTAEVPIIMLTARGEEADIVTGLELGADDYLTKPFSPKVLLARIRTVLRRREAPPPGPTALIDDEGLVIDRGKRDVRVAGRPVTLTFTEFEILALLAGRKGWVFTRNQIVNAVRGEDYYVTERSVDVQIVGLRKKLGLLGERIETVRGVGYRYRDPD
jgi:two-component system alkaline phosphatase synthesis response regulator PhoP